MEVYHEEWDLFQRIENVYHRKAEKQQSRAYARGVGLKTPLALDILQKLCYLRKGD